MSILPYLKKVKWKCFIQKKNCHCFWKALWKFVLFKVFYKFGDIDKIYLSDKWGYKVNCYVLTCWIVAI